MSYHQLTQYQRHELGALVFGRKHSYREIARLLGVHHNTVSRELRRHSWNNVSGYDAVQASKWKRYRAYVARPLARVPGDLIQTDTVHIVDVVSRKRVYLYTLIDVYSRWAYVEYHEHISQAVSLAFLRRGEQWFGNKFLCIQADNGPEFGRWLQDQLKARGSLLRHSRVRKPNDNAHIERFNRTIQEEGLRRLFPKPEMIHTQLFDYLAYYNEQRLHSSLQHRTPQEMLQRS